MILLINFYPVKYIIANYKYLISNEISNDKWQIKRDSI